MDIAVPLATLIFATMAGIGGVIRVLQNERYYRWSKKIHKQDPKPPTNAPDA